MKYFLTLTLFLCSIFAFSQSRNNQIKLGYQLMSTPYIGTGGEGYHGQFEHFFGDQFSISLGIGQVVGQEITNHGSSGTINGISFDNRFSLKSREGVNYLDMTLLYRPFKLLRRNHFKVGFGVGMQSVWVEFPENALVLSGVVQEINFEKHIINFASYNIVLENDFYLTPEISLNGKIVARLPNEDMETPAFDRRVVYVGRGTGVSISSTLNPNIALVLGIGYRF